LSLKGRNVEKAKKKSKPTPFDRFEDVAKRLFAVKKSDTGKQAKLEKKTKSTVEK